MIAVDTNMLIHSHRRDSAWHDSALRVMIDLAEGTESWSIPWPCIHEFYAIVTHPRVFSPASTIDEALTQIDAWLASPTVGLIGETFDHIEALRTIVSKGRIVDGAIHDARIAAICISHGVREFWSADRDFSRMPGLKVRNPLI